MKLAEAAEIWLECRRFFDRHKEKKRQMKEAEKVLRAHFNKTKRSKYQGVGCSRTPYTYLSVSAVRRELGEGAKRFEEEGERVSLYPLD